MINEIEGLGKTIYKLKNRINKEIVVVVIKVKEI